MKSVGSRGAGYTPRYNLAEKGARAYNNNDGSEVSKTCRKRTRYTIAPLLAPRFLKRETVDRDKNEGEKRRGTGRRG